jgi:hypothetical protein
MMSEEKVVSRSVAVGLGMLCIIFMASLAGTIVYHTMMINNKDESYDDYVASHSYTNSEYDSLDATYQTYAGTHSHNNSEYDSLSSQNTALQDQVNYLQYQVKNFQNEVINLRSPRLIQVNWNEWDSYPLFVAPCLEITGMLFNVGSDPAYCRLHVVLYQSGGGVANDTYVELGTIDGESWIYVGTSVFYEGSFGPLTGWNVTTEY